MAKVRIYFDGGSDAEINGTEDICHKFIENWISQMNKGFGAPNSPCTASINRDNGRPECAIRLDKVTAMFIVG